jgi:hypothetical protein
MKWSIVAAVGGTVVAIITIFVFVLPLLRSDPPPLAGLDRVALLQKALDNSLLAQDKTTQMLGRLSSRMDQQELDYWNGQVALAEIRLKVMPNDGLATSMIKIARDRITMLQANIAIPTK